MCIECISNTALNVGLVSIGAAMAPMVSTLRMAKWNNSDKNELRKYWGWKQSKN